MVAHSQVSIAPDTGRSDTLLRRALVGNALFSALTGLLLIAGSGWISDFTGLSPRWVPAAIGVGVLFWAIEVTVIVRNKKEISPSRARLVIAGDLAWVVVSYAVIFGGAPELTTAGAWTVGVLAEFVALFAVVQYLGLRRATS